MKKGILLFGLFAFVLFGARCEKISAWHQTPEKIHEDLLTIDTHNDTPYNLLRDDWDVVEEHDPSDRQSGKMDLPRMQKGGLDAAFFAAFVSQRDRTPENYQWAVEKTNELIYAVNNMCEEHPDIINRAVNACDAEQNAADHLLSAYIGIENGFAIGLDIQNIEKFYKAGARYITLCHTRNNDICDSSTDSDGPEHDGLSVFGENVVREMNRLGMLVDVSHCSDSAFYDILRTSAVPVIASHSCARAICDNPRNLTDAMLIKLAENGGVMQMCILSDYVKTPPENSSKKAELVALREKYGSWSKITDEKIKQQYSDEYYAVQDKYAYERATVQDVVDHIDHIVQLVGIDYVGIGTDFDGGGGVIGCNDVSEMGNITKELLARGYSINDIEKIWSGNFLRVFRNVEQYASRVSS